MDEQKLSGLELQSRFDNGGFFTDLSVAYNLKMKCVIPIAPLTK